MWWDLLPVKNPTPFRFQSQKQYCIISGLTSFLLLIEKIYTGSLRLNDGNLFPCQTPHQFLLFKSDRDILHTSSESLRTLDLTFFLLAFFVFSTANLDRLETIIFAEKQNKT